VNVFQISTSYRNVAIRLEITVLDKLRLPGRSR
jgi:hypothetical protein